MSKKEAKTVVREAPRSGMNRREFLRLSRDVGLGAAMLSFLASCGIDPASGKETLLELEKPTVIPTRISGQPVTNPEAVKVVPTALPASGSIEVIVNQPPTPEATSVPGTVMVVKKEGTLLAGMGGGEGSPINDLPAIQVERELEGTPLTNLGVEHNQVGYISGEVEGQETVSGLVLRAGETVYLIPLAFPLSMTQDGKEKPILPVPDRMVGVMVSEDQLEVFDPAITIGLPASEPTPSLTMLITADDSLRVAYREGELDPRTGEYQWHSDPAWPRPTIAAYRYVPGTRFDSLGEAQQTAMIRLATLAGKQEYDWDDLAVIRDRVGTGTLNLGGETNNPLAWLTDDQQVWVMGERKYLIQAAGSGEAGEAIEDTLVALPPVAEWDEGEQTLTWQEEGRQWRWNRETKQAETFTRLEIKPRTLTWQERNRLLAGAMFTPVEEFAGRVFEVEGLRVGETNLPVILAPGVAAELAAAAGSSVAEEIAQAVGADMEWGRLLEHMMNRQDRFHLVNDREAGVYLVEAEGGKMLVMVEYCKQSNNALLRYRPRGYFLNSRGEAVSNLLNPQNGIDDILLNSTSAINYFQRLSGDKVVVDDGVRAAAELTLTMEKLEWHTYTTEERLAGEAELYQGHELVGAIRARVKDKLGDDGTWIGLTNANGEMVAVIKQGGRGGLSAEYVAQFRQAVDRINQLDPGLMDLFTRQYGMMVVTGNTQNNTCFNGKERAWLATYDGDTIYRNQNDPEGRYRSTEGNQWEMGILIAEGRGIGFRNQQCDRIIPNNSGKDKGAYLERWLSEYGGALTRDEVSALEVLVKAHRDGYGDW